MLEVGVRLPSKIQKLLNPVLYNMNVRTRILILSDTHSALPDKVRHPQYPYSHEFLAADVAIHCGDLTSTGKPEEHERALELLRSLPAPVKIVIPGNHDLTLDKSYCSTHADRSLHTWRRKHTQTDLDQALELYTGADALQAGILYLTEGVRAVPLANGALLNIYASAWTPEFYDWAFTYPRSHDRFNLDEENVPQNPIPVATRDAPLDQIHVVATHGPPAYILDKTVRGGEHVGCEHLLRAVEKCRPLLHCFGHIHEGWGAERVSWQQSVVEPRNSLVDASSSSSIAEIDGTDIEVLSETIFVNASIMNVRYRPCQKPLLVDLMLPLQKQESTS